MDTKAVTNVSTHTLTVMYDLHTKLFRNVLVDISDKDAQNRLNTKANHIAWLAGSLVQQRCELANIFGIDIKQTADALFKDFQGIQEDATYPSLNEYKRDWEKISPILRDALANASEEQLNGPDPFKMPGGDYTFYDILTFMVDRESYCIGQIGLYRRLLGYEAMKYE